MHVLAEGSVMFHQHAKEAFIQLVLVIEIELSEKLPQVIDLVKG